MNACEALLENVPEDAIAYFSDEAQFHLTGCFNKQNIRYWTDSDPRNFIKGLCFHLESECGVLVGTWLFLRK